MGVNRLYAFVGLFLLASTASAYTVPSKIPVQGRLTNASTGVVLSGEYDFTFRIYNASTSGTLLWDENQTLTVDGNGLWNALLGNNTSLSLNFSEDTYLEVELNHDGNPLPRVQLGSTPYAEWTDTAGNVSCTDCLGTDEIEDVYLLNTGDTTTGNYNFGGGDLFINDTSGYVGIGTTNPNYNLHLHDTAAWIQLTASTGGNTSNDGLFLGMNENNWSYLITKEDAGIIIKTNNTERIRVDSSGKVGIGTTTPRARMEVKDAVNDTVAIFAGTAGASGGVIGAPKIGIDYFNTAVNPAVLIGAEEDSSGGYASSLTFATRAINSDVAPTERMRITSDGNVGIGTTSPTSKLEVSDDLLVYDKVWVGQDNSSAGGRFEWYANDIYLIDNTQGGKVIFRTTPSGGGSDLDRMAIDSAGNVGIGTTSPDAILNVFTETDRTDESAGIPLRLGSSTTGKMQMYFGVNDANNYAYIGAVETGTSYRNLLLQPNGGKVGIGTTSPISIFDVKAATNQHIQVVSNGNGADSGTVTLSSINDSNSGYTPMGLLASRFHFIIGNVGIGTTSPNDALDVVGDIDATGCVQTDDSGSIGGTCISDVRFKTNVRALEGSLDRIYQLNPVSFQWDPAYYNISSENGTGVGLIAQELEEVYPELVVTDEDGYKRVRYDIELEMHLIQAVKELKAENDALKSEKDAEIDGLSSDNVRLTGLVGNLTRIVCADHPEEDFCRAEPF